MGYIVIHLRLDEAHEGFGDHREELDHDRRCGEKTLKLYRIKRGIQIILAHTAGRPDVKRRVRKQKPSQLKLF